MDNAEARAVLAVGPTAGPDEIRAAFRRQVRTTHPDVATDATDAGRRTARLVQAYAALRRAPAAIAAPSPAPAPPPGHDPVVLAGGDSLLWDVPPREAFRLLVEVADSIGDITYLDVDAGLLDVVLPAGGIACSLMATVTPRPGPGPASEVLFALEPLGAEARPPSRPVVAAVAAHLARARRAVVPHQSNSGNPQARRPT